MMRGVALKAVAASMLVSVAWVGAVDQANPGQPDPNRPVALFVVDLDGDGFDFVSAESGVRFDIDGVGTPVAIGWTAADADDSFLFLDTNANGLVDSGRELLGNGWRKSDGSRVISGDEALMDVQGINAKGVPLGPVPEPLAHGAFIATEDDVYRRLRLWRDANHNGRSEPSELRTLPEAQVLKVHVGFRMLNRQRDAVGNVRLLQGSVYVQGRATDVNPVGHEGRPMVEVEFERRR